LDAVIHPVPTEVRKVVKERQDAVVQALQDNKDDIEKLVKPVRQKSASSEPLEDIQPVVQPTSNGERDGERVRNWRLYGIGAGVLVAVALGIAAVNSLLRKNLTAVPTQDVTHELPTTHPTLLPFTSPAASTVSPLASAIPTPDLKRMKTSEVDGMNLLYVQEGEFKMGSETGEIDEIPVHTVFLDAFWIDQTEVTNAMYAKCVHDRQCNPPPRTFSNTRDNYYGNPEFDNYPVIHVSWEDAQKYCAWAERRLPTEAEWEKAARRSDGRTYPWGNSLPDDSLLNYNHPNIGDTTEVGTYPAGASPYGVLDMAGNVWEWVGDRYSDTYYDSSPTSNPPGPNEPANRVIRGGGWQQGYKEVRSANRYNQPPRYTTRGLGFRCADSS
jgi:formylglycine-generating enzyme required for sulfatase activity